MPPWWTPHQRSTTLQPQTHNQTPLPSLTTPNFDRNTTLSYRHFSFDVMSLEPFCNHHDHHEPHLCCYDNPHESSNPTIVFLPNSAVGFDLNLGQKSMGKKLQVGGFDLDLMVWFGGSLFWIWIDFWRCNIELVLCH